MSRGKAASFLALLVAVYVALIPFGEQRRAAAVNGSWGPSGGGGGGGTCSGDLNSGCSQVKAISGSTPIAITPNELQYVVGATPTIDQVTSTGTATGATMTIAAQSETGVGGVGGKLLLKSGQGDNASDDGIVHIQTGRGAGCYLDMGTNGIDETDIAANPFILYDPSSAAAAVTFTPSTTSSSVVQFAKGASSVTVQQLAGNTNNATGAVFTVAAQNEVGTTSTGGELDLKSGTGTGTQGALGLFIGSNAMWKYTDNAPVAGFTTVNVTGATDTLTAAQSRNPIVIITGTLSANETVVFPNVVGAFWVVDVCGVVAGANTFAMDIGSGACSLVAVTSARCLMTIFAPASNTCHANQ